MRKTGRGHPRWRFLVALGAAALLAGCGSGGGRNATGDLKSLLTDKGIAYQGAACVHGTGNDYSCIVTTATGQVPVQVTDDGHEIIEQGISAPGQ